MKIAIRDGGGAPGGAKWVEIRELIARCEDLSEDVRGELVAWGDRCELGSQQLSPNDVG